MAGSKKLLLVLALALASGAVGLGMFGQPRTDPAVPPIPVRAVNDPPGKGAPGADEPKADAADEKAVAAHIKALRDPDSKTRATAAEELRRIVAKYPSKTVYLSTKDGGEAAWQEKVNKIEPGMTKAEVLKILPKFADAPDSGELASGQSHVVTYRLDYHWMVRIYYRNPDKVIERPTLMKHALRIFVPPPKDFTGSWIAWHVNGQKGYEIQYKDGFYEGVFTSFHDNGARHTEQHYADRDAHGPGAGWFADGRLCYTIQYRRGKKDGRWAHWYANGNKHSETDYVDDKLHGRDVRWHENGQIAGVNEYKNDVKHGLEASWDEKGKPHYERIFVNGNLVD